MQSFDTSKNILECVEYVNQQGREAHIILSAVNMVRVTYLSFSKNDCLNTVSIVYNKLFPFVDLKANAAMNIIHK